jgi:AAA15 family ATPase/GTPase
VSFEISFRNFRGFYDQLYVPVKPITILVGENSAGKTSFLSGTKYIIDFLSGRGDPSFNSDPFQLGTYDQIAHFRGGRGGRAKEFEISLKQTVSVRKPRSKYTGGEFPVEIQLTFSSIDSHAGVRIIRLIHDRQSFEIQITQDGIQTSYINDKNERFTIDKASSVPPIARTEFARYWPFLIRDLRFRVERQIGDESTSLFSGTDDVLLKFADLTDALIRRIPYRLEATSAIRTRPLRTYTPGIEQQDGEGSHVPFEIAKLYRSRTREPNDWKRVKEAIEKFGAESEMFKELSVKSFGQTASDPFQIVFSSDGPKTNLVDLGYGTSQILPIIYNIAKSSIAKSRRSGYFLIQQPEVHLHPKAQAALGQYFVDSYKSTGLRFVLETHSDFIVDRIRQSIAEGKLRNDDVSILFFERDRLENRITHINLDEHGEPLNPPVSYRAFFIGEAMKILGV